jgi:hypothetical protein
MRPAVLWSLHGLLGMEPEIRREAVFTLAIPTASIPVIEKKRAFGTRRR